MCLIRLQFAPFPELVKWGLGITMRFQLLLKFYLQFITVSRMQFRDSFDSDQQSKWLSSTARLVGKI